MEHHILLKCHNQGDILFRVVHFLQPVIKMTMQCKMLLVKGLFLKKRGMSRQRQSETLKFGIKQVDNGQISTVKR